MKLAANDKPAVMRDANGVELPQTDAGTTLQILLGLMFALSGLTLLWISRKQTVRS
jgi:LPXTG-motif cell wall-anchored protein